jgi:hypothetical protein
MSDTLILAILAVVGSLGGVLLGKFWDRFADRERWQRERGTRHEQFLQERRVDAYAQLLAAGEQVYLNRTTEDAETTLEELRRREEDRRKLSAALGQIDVFGTERAMELGGKLIVMLTNSQDKFPSKDEFSSMWATIRAQFRSDLGVKD